MWTQLLDIGTELLKRVIPDADKRKEAELELLRQTQSGQLRELQARMSAIVTEASSSDPFTRRARPGFLWTMYAILLCAVPIGVLSIFAPGAAERLIGTMTAFWAAIPERMYWLMGSVMLGYTGSRTYEKAKGVAR